MRNSEFVPPASPEGPLFFRCQIFAIYDFLQSIECYINVESLNQFCWRHDSIVAIHDGDSVYVAEPASGLGTH